MMLKMLRMLKIRTSFKSPLYYKFILPSWIDRLNVSCIAHNITASEKTVAFDIEYGLIMSGGETNSQ